METTQRIPTPMRRPLPGEEGYILVAVMFLLAILVMSMAVAVPRIKAEIQRDREVETMQRGKQYARAIKMYYKKFNAYPPNIDALGKTNNIRFLRKRYLDPMTGKDDWKPIMFGQNKAPLAMGFFGQPLAGGAMALAGTGPQGGNGIAGATTLGGGLNGSSSGSAFSSGSTFSSGGSAFGSGQNSQSGAGGISGTSGTSGTNSSGTGSAFGGGSGTTSSTQTYGGAGIIGFEPASDKESILTYKKKNHYNQWEFTYSPLADQTMQGGNGGSIGQPANPSNNGTGLFNNNGTPTGNGIFSNGPTTNQPAAPTTPTSPQQ